MMASRLLLLSGLLWGHTSAVASGLRRGGARLRNASFSSGSRPLDSADVFSGLLFPESASSPTAESLSSGRTPEEESSQERQLSFAESSGASSSKASSTDEKSLPAPAASSEPSASSLEDLERKLHSETEALQEELLTATRLARRLEDLDEKDPGKEKLRAQLQDLRKQRQQRNQALDEILAKLDAKASTLRSEKQKASLHRLTTKAIRIRGQIEKLLLRL